MPRHSVPQTEHDWTIHAINIHGTFLEAWCRDLVDHEVGWSLVSYKYPVSWQGEAGELDVRADTRQGTSRISFLIECKKNNPELTEWVFLRKRRGAAPSTASPVARLRLDVDAAGRVTLGEAGLFPFPWTSVIADDARDTRGDYRTWADRGTKTKTSNSAVYDAAKQVSLAYRAIVQEEISKVNRAINTALIAQYPRHLVFVPIIVTTAKLHVCDFDPKDVNPASGELPWDKAILTEVAHLRYEFTLPATLQWPRELLGRGDFPDWSEPSIRQWIGIVNAAYFESFLRHYNLHLTSWTQMPSFPDTPSAPTAEAATP